MTKEEMKAGLTRGRTLIQEEWSSESEISAVNELVAEGFAQATQWTYGDNYQCDFRTVTKK